jgi:CRISPR-associated protein Csd1
LILQALDQLAHREHLVEDPDYEWKPVAWLIRVGEGGQLLGIQGTHSVPEEDERDAKRSKKPKPRPKNLPVPREAGRTSGDRAFFLFDKAEYALGLDPEPDPAKRRPSNKLSSRLSLFRQRVEECLAATDDEGARAVCAFLDRVSAGAVPTLPEGCVGNDLFAFIYAPDIDLLVTSRPKVQQYWRSVRALSEGSDENKRRCLVSGRLAVPVDKLPGIKNVPGGGSSGIALVSFNSNAFESYGWTGNDNAPISRESAEAISTALNRLLHPAFPDPSNPGQTLPRRHLRLSADTAVCFWAASPAGDELTAQLLGLLDANPDDVKNLYRSVWEGKPAPVDEPSAFYALTLTGTRGRAVIRDWFETTVAEVSRNLAQHFADLAIVRNTPVPKGKPLPPMLPLRTLVRALAVHGDEKNVPGALAAQFIRAALTGFQYPISILHRAVERARAEIGQSEWSDLERRDARAALTKAVLNRRRRIHPTSYPEVTESMDPNNQQPGYLLGRLMAVIERTQIVALSSEINASAVDRFFSSASASPAAVFPRLLKNLRHHARKAKDEGKAVVYLEKLVDQLLEPLADFPSYLPVDQQGLFLLGYHHQRHAFFQGKQGRPEAEQSSENS